MTFLRFIVFAIPMFLSRCAAQDEVVLVQVLHRHGSKVCDLCRGFCSLCAVPLLLQFALRVSVLQVPDFPDPTDADFWATWGVPGQLTSIGMLGWFGIFHQRHESYSMFIETTLSRRTRAPHAGPVHPQSIRSARRHPGMLLYRHLPPPSHRVSYASCRTPLAHRAV